MSKLFDKLAIVTGTRREGAAAVPVKLTAPCCLLGGDLAETLRNSSAGPSNQRVYTVVFRTADWPDAAAPQTGYGVSVDGFPAMRIKTVHALGVREWVCEAYT